MSHWCLTVSVSWQDTWIILLFLQNYNFKSVLFWISHAWEIKERTDFHHFMTIIHHFRPKLIKTEFILWCWLTSWGEELDLEKCCQQAKLLTKLQVFRIQSPPALAFSYPPPFLTYFSERKVDNDLLEQKLYSYAGLATSLTSCWLGSRCFASRHLLPLPFPPAFSLLPPRF